MTEQQFFEFIGADELATKTLAEAHRDRRYRKPSEIIYSNNGSGDSIITPNGEVIFIYDAIEWVKLTCGDKHLHLACDSCRHTKLLHFPNSDLEYRYLEFCARHPFSFDHFCTGCDNAVYQPYPVYPSDHGRFLNVEKSRIPDQVSDSTLTNPNLPDGS